MGGRGVGGEKEIDIEVVRVLGRSMIVRENEGIVKNYRDLVLRFIIVIVIKCGVIKIRCYMC